MAPGMADFIALREELNRLGYARRTPFALFCEWLLLIALYVGALVSIFLVETWWAKCAAMVVLTFAGMGIATNTHTASHNAISRRKWLNDLFLYFGYPFLHQVSATFWRHKHLVLHHPNPNVIGVDYDADLAPYFALDRAEFERAKGFHRWWYRHQVFFLPFLLAGNFFSMAYAGWRFLLRRLADPTTRSRAHVLDLAALLLHWVVWVIVPMMFLNPLDVLLFALARFGMMSYAMFAVFAPGHIPVAAQLIDKDAKRGNFLMMQTLTTMNFRTGPIGRLLCGGLEFQIEHHLFPTISPRHYPEMSGHVKAFCDKHGYPYRSEAWGKALWLSLRAFWHPKPIRAGLPAPGSAEALVGGHTQDADRNTDFDASPNASA